MLCAVVLMAVFYGSGQNPGVDVTFSGHGGLELRGTVLKPDTDMVCPGMVLLPGSGPTDRDGNQLPGLRTDLLKQVAEHLAANGIASLRFDKRATPGYAAKFPKSAEDLDEFFSFDAFREDAKAALAFLRSYPGIDGSKTGMLGHSEGGLITLAAAAEGGPNGPAVVVLYATAGRTLGPVIREQVGANLAASTLSAEQKQAYFDYIDKANKEIAETGKVPGNAPAGMAAVYPSYAGRLLRAYLTLDPVALCKKVEVPAFVLQGDQDAQVSCDRDFPLLVVSLNSRAGIPTRSLLVKAGSHNLKEVVGKNRHAFNGPVIPEVLGATSDWLKGQFRS